MSYEKEITSKIEKNEDLPKKLDISMVKYFWQANPLSSRKGSNLPKFLRRIEVLKNFSDNELRILSKFMHLRTFENKEVVFRQHDLGVGFYLVYSGHVDVIVDSDKESDSERSNYLLSLERRDYFGELALLQENSARNATVIARGNTELVGIFKPDVELLISNYPIVAAKLLQSVSLIIANRLFSVTREVRELKYKLSQAEVGKNASKR
ncbi:MAG: CRP-like cAMP-binding protein [Bacteriovoracaceae bacterium]|jgi:CRP-like cAMP-binding protein